MMMHREAELLVSLDSLVRRYKLEESNLRGGKTIVYRTTFHLAIHEALIGII